MLLPPAPAPDLHEEGGQLPDGTEAFSVRSASASPIPVLIAVPHGGRAYPPDLIAMLRDPQRAALRLEDRFADKLGKAVAEATGAALIVAHAPRAMLDLNRAADDIDWEMIEGGVPRDVATAPSRRARGGLGLVPRRVPGLGELWRGRLAAAELQQRIACIHRPYHARVSHELERLHRRWGVALLIDLHSMPPLPRGESGQPAAEFVVGDRFGASCDGGLVAAAFAHLAETGARAAHNRPYAGGYVLDRHAAPGRGIHALQLEIDRHSYLDPAMREPGAGFERAVAIIAGLVRRLAAETALLGNDAAPLREAAE